MISDENRRNRPKYDFRTPVNVEEMLERDVLLVRLIQTRAIQRLKNIRFLGGIDYLLVKSPNGAKGNIRHTRYQHSLGVTRLAIFYSKARSLPVSEHRLLSAAALLHDVGHAPLSHSLEPVFQETFGINHHRATTDIILGNVPIGKEVFDILRDSDVDVDRLLSVVTRNTGDFDGFFDGPINFDTVEGILRSQTYATPRAVVLGPETVIDAALNRTCERHRDLVDEFWRIKDEIYRRVIHSEEGILADFVCRLFALRYINDLRADDYFTSEDYMFRKLHGLRELLTSRQFGARVRPDLPTSIPYKERRFYVDEAADFFAREDRGRYRQIKTDRVLMLKSLDEFATGDTRIGDLFRDESY